MKLKRSLCAAFIAVFATLALFATFTASAENILSISVPMSGEYIGYTDFKGYKAQDGLVSTKSATLSVMSGSFMGRAGVTKLTSGSGSSPIAIKHTSLAKAGIPLYDIRYVRYAYYYSGELPKERAELVVKKSQFNLSDDRTVYAMEEITEGGWSYLTFDFGEFVRDYVLTGGTLPEMTFYPFGQAPASEFSGGDVLYLDEIMILSESSALTIAARNEGNLRDLYPVYFVSGRADAVGEDPEILFVEAGEKVTMPECPYTLKGHRFLNWVCSDGNVIYNPGDEATIISKSITGSRTTARTYFVADWAITGSAVELALPEINVVPFGDYNNGSNGVVDQSKGGMYALRTLNVEFDNIMTTKYQFLPEAEGSGRTIVFDGWTWDAMPLDISHYKYCAFVYYWDTDSTRSYTPKLAPLGSATAPEKALTTSITFTGKSSLKKNQWAVCGFDIDFVNNSTNHKYVRWDTNTIVNQMHFYPFGNGTYAKAQYMSEDDVLYIGNFIFFENKPTANPTFSDGYVNGFEDGTFKPTEMLTNAQAAVLLANALGATDEQLSEERDTLYTDLEEDWYKGAVTYLEEMGILKPKKGDKFNPDEYSDRNSFVNLLISSLSGDTESEAVNEKKLPESKETGAVTRAEAITNINAILKGAICSPANTSFAAIPFVDVNPSQWFYSDIAFASTRAVLYTDANGNTGIADTPGLNKETGGIVVPDITEEHYEEGEAYINHLDIITEDRISEIRNTESDYAVKPNGKIYYISSSEGFRDNNGLSESNPKFVSALDEVSAIALNPGDVVLFKRGDTFIGSLTAKPGVTYSAYGYGDKPILTRSPAGIADRNKWELYYSDNTGKKIWVYTDNNIVDVGAINLINARGENLVAYKEIPSFENGKFWVRGQKGVKEYDLVEELRHNYMYFHDARFFVNGNGEYIPITSGVPNPGNAVGPVYLRCDEGNPGTQFSKIYFNLRGNVISCGSSNGVTIDNICILYFGSHGVGAGTIHNLTVKNCEIGWGGGAIQHYGTNDSGDVTRFGNGIEIYGGLANYRIENCYVYEIYDAGITHQISSTSDGNYFMEGVYYHNNILLNSSYNIEYFMSKNSSTDRDGKIAVRERMMKDVYFTDNIVRMAGYGWGVQRPDSAPSNIKGWTHNNFCDNYVIENNVFDRCINLRSGDDYVIQVGTSFANSNPYLKNNIFVQVPGRTLMRFGGGVYKTLADSEDAVLNAIAGDGNKLYFCREDRKQYEHHVYWEG